MIDAVTSQFSPNLGRKMENAVAIELLRRQHDGIFHYKTKDNKEVDFVVKNGTSVSELIQVCYAIADPKTKAREVSALVKAAGEIKCGRNTVITWDEESSLQQHDISIKLVPLRRWLLDQRLTIKPHVIS